MRAIDVRHMGRERVTGCWELDGVLVDPGPKVSERAVLDALAGRAPEAILLTHVHLDHAGATGSLLRRWGAVPVYVHERGAPHLVDPARLLASAERIYPNLDERWGRPEPVPAACVRRVADGDVVRGFRVAYTPGHASHHLAFLHEASGTALVGDVAGVRIAPSDYTLMPTPPPDIDVEAWIDSLATIEAWRPERLALTHFGAHRSPRGCWPTPARSCNAGRARRARPPTATPSWPASTPSSTRACAATTCARRTARPTLHRSSTSASTATGGRSGPSGPGARDGASTIDRDRVRGPRETRGHAGREDGREPSWQGGDGMRVIDVLHMGREHVIGCWQLDDGALVDPGPRSCEATLLAALGDEPPPAIVLTHIHLDHAGAVGSLVRRWPDVPVYVHAKGAPHMADPSRLVASAKRLWDDVDVRWGEVVPVPEANLRVIDDGDRVHGCRVAYTPGHASHHVSLLHEASGRAFVGDVAGVRRPGSRLTVPPTPPPDIDVEAWHASIDLVAGWSPAALAITHFGLHEAVDVLLAAAHEELARLAEAARTLDAETFLARFEADVAERADDPAAAEAYLQAVPGELQHPGLERYWTKRRSTEGEEAHAG